MRSESETAPADVLVRNAELLVTMPGVEIPGGWVTIRAGRVEAAGPPGEERPARDVIDVSGCLVTPGLINTHHHIFQNLTRAFRPVVNADLLTWLHELGRVWLRLDEEASYVSAWIGFAELLLGGCTTTADHLHVHPAPGLVDAEVAAARDVGIRLHAARGAMDLREADGGVVPDAAVQSVETILADFERLVDQYHERSADAMVRVALAPSSPFDSTPDLLRAAAELAERLDVRLHTHLAQVPGEEAYCLERFGRRPVDLFEDAGWGSSRSWIAHCIFASDDDIARLGRFGTGIAHCPSSNMMICEGIAPVRELRAAGAPVGLGCDGSASTDHASLWLEARTALLLGRLRSGPTGMSARDVLALATLGSAACLGRSGEIGVLTPGACGDLVAWPLEGVSFAGAWSDPVEAWLRCGPVHPLHTVVGGHALVRDGSLALRGLEEMLRRHAAIARSWQELAG
ncbi:MAG: amidohydrolase family protein [Actinomycetota bacterium]|nr:amidohydrolase family protein [Actinomycetota bacterium]